MDWQQIIALAIVAVTAGLMAWFRFRPRRLGRGHGACCGCSSGADSVPRETVVFHARKGERPQIIVRSAGTPRGGDRPAAEPALNQRLETGGGLH